MLQQYRQFPLQFFLQMNYISLLEAFFIAQTARSGCQQRWTLSTQQNSCRSCLCVHGHSVLRVCVYMVIVCCTGNSFTNPLSTPAAQPCFVGHLKAALILLQATLHTAKQVSSAQTDSEAQKHKSEVGPGLAAEPLTPILRVTSMAPGLSLLPHLVATHPSESGNTSSC